ncbi:PQQ-dependent sugar dehydrogenase [Streptomyces hainanensis]|uniref:PQQ-dependent sugar dehydrogenase n=1 Tax=Streptomyces hainanensis TaxID=402648 RepID=A0A4R4TC48_9ACTN|nr:PQQ-dependent sugar dehydrogenase [Streptomyces hainanensis]TDC74850.1 PQQ-dependent sugar dehydrogenase [Streptomyces hainanensis]
MRRRDAALVAVVTTLALAVTGCSGSDSGDEGADGTEGAQGATAGASGSSEPTPDEPAPGATGSSGAPVAPDEGAVEVVETVADGLDSPWGLVRLPDGDLLVGSRDGGTVHRIATASGDVTEVGTVPGVAPEGEGGLLGLALDPEFASSGLLFAYYTTAEDNRITAFRYDSSATSGGGLTTDRDLLTGIPRGEFIHHGGGLAFGPDGMLHAATGDAGEGEGELAQDPDSLAGKILRIDPATGEPPADNPDPGSLVYSAGHRNVQGLAWDAEGNLWASEFGQDTWDELNRIEPGRNYGWPLHEGPGGEADGFTDPIRWWPPDEASPSGLAFQGGSLWLAGLRGERLWRAPLTDADPEAFLTGEFGRLRAVLAVGDDELLLVTNETDTRGTPSGPDDRVLRLRVR